MLPELTIVIPTRTYENANYTLESLKLSSYQNFKVIVVSDEGKGAPYARNKGFLQVDTEFVLFSDNDIQWTINGIKSMIDCLKANPEIAYSYGTNRIGDYTQSTEEFDPELLKKHNYISTMSVIRAKDFPGFDESLRRFQDWDVWLNLLINHNKVGKHCGKVIFHTPIRAGITQDRELTELEAAAIIKAKYNLNTPYL